MKTLKAIVIGATGLVGKQLIIQLLENDQFDKITVFGRRSIQIDHPKLTEKLVNFNQINKWADAIQGDVLFSTLGTTIKTAGSKENQYQVDFTYQYEVAMAAAKNGVKNYVLVSSSNANSKSQIFYSKMKGQLDDDVQRLDFKKVTILRPSILDGDRKEHRSGEKLFLKLMNWMCQFILKKYRPIKDRIVAQAMIKAVSKQQENCKTSIYNLDEVFDLARKI